MRRHALIDFESALLQTFEKIASSLEPEVRDLLHFALFSESDRLCLSSAWLIAPRAGVSLEKFRLAASSVEMLRCSTLAKERSPISTGLIPLAFRTILCGEGPLSQSERAEIAAVLANDGSPLQALTALQIEQRTAREGIRNLITRNDLKAFHLLKIGAPYRAVGQTLEYLTSRSDLKNGRLTDWFVKLGLFAYWVYDFLVPTSSAYSLNHLMTYPEAMDLIKSQEAELFELSRKLDLHDAASEIIIPLADLLNSQLQ